MKLRGETVIPSSKTGSLPPACRAMTAGASKALEVIIDREEQVAEIWNARFRVANVPIFYSPYLQLPIGDKRCPVF